MQNIIRYSLISVLLSLPIFLCGADASKAILHSGFIYDENAPTPECHASTVVETASGDIAAAWFGGTHEKNPDVCIWISFWKDEKWSEPKNIADGMQADGKRYPTWNPVLFQAPGGKDKPLILFYKVGPNPVHWWGMQKKSYDGGHTWGEAERLPDGIWGPIKNKPVVLADGSWLSPSSTEFPKDGWRVHFEHSTDEGKTWTVIKPKKAKLEFDAIQPSILFFPDGRLEALSRTKQGVIAMSWSEDGGKTWSAQAATELPNPNSGTDAVTLKDGRQLLIYNHSAHRPDKPGNGWRYPIGLATSTDGLHWTRVLTLDDAPLPEGYAYPAIIQASDGLVYITYTWDRKRMRYIILDPAQLP